MLAESYSRDRRTTQLPMNNRSYNADEWRCTIRQAESPDEQKVRSGASERRCISQPLLPSLQSERLAPILPTDGLMNTAEQARRAYLLDNPCNTQQSKWIELKLSNKSGRPDRFPANQCEPEALHLRTHGSDPQTNARGGRLNPPTNPVGVNPNGGQLWPRRTGDARSSG